MNLLLVLLLMVLFIKVERNVLVFDFGKETLDITILNICDNTFEVKSIIGNTNLDGEDFDNQMMNVFRNLKKKTSHLRKLKSSTLKKRKNLRRKKMTLSYAHNSYSSLNMMITIKWSQMKSLTRLSKA